MIVAWIGINDVINNYFGQHIEGQFKELFELHEQVYNTGARNFLFFNVPNFERAPCCRFPKIPPSVPQADIHSHPIAPCFHSPSPFLLLCTWKNGCQCLCTCRLIPGQNSEGYRSRVREWNSRLTAHTILFRTSHPDTNISI